MWLSGEGKGILVLTLEEVDDGHQGHDGPIQLANHSLLLLRIDGRVRLILGAFKLTNRGLLVRRRGGLGLQVIGCRHLDLLLLFGFEAGVSGIVDRAPANGLGRIWIGANWSPQQRLRSVKRWTMATLCTRARPHRDVNPFADCVDAQHQLLQLPQLSHPLPDIRTHWKCFGRESAHSQELSLTEETSGANFPPRSRKMRSTQVVT